MTAPPVYYLFIVTGRIVLGRWEHLRGFDVFESTLAKTVSPNHGFAEGAWSSFLGLIEHFGLPLPENAPPARGGQGQLF